MIKVSKSKIADQICTITIDSNYVDMTDDAISVSLNATELHGFIASLMGVLENRLQIEKAPARVVSKATKAYSDNS